MAIWAGSGTAGRCLVGADVPQRRQLASDGESVSNDGLRRAGPSPKTRSARPLGRIPEPACRPSQTIDCHASCPHTRHRRAPEYIWIIQAMEDLVMDLDDASCRARLLLPDRDVNRPGLGTHQGSPSKPGAIHRPRRRQMRCALHFWPSSLSTASRPAARRPCITVTALWVSFHVAIVSPHVSSGR
jgi:hypothetical protein